MDHKERWTTVETEHAIALGFRYGGFVLAVIAFFIFLTTRDNYGTASGAGSFWALLFFAGLGLSYYGHVLWQKIRLERDED